MSKEAPSSPQLAVRPSNSPSRSTDCKRRHDEKARIPIPVPDGPGRRRRSAGDYSVHVLGSRKVMGVGQRLTRSAAQVGGMIVVDGAEVLSPGGLRHADEAVRHKMLDALGDLTLAGAPLLARPGLRATAVQPGHQ